MRGADLLFSIRPAARGKLRPDVLLQRCRRRRLRLRARRARRQPSDRVEPVRVGAIQHGRPGFDLRLEGQGHPEVGRTPHALAEKLRRRHANDRERGLVQQNGATDDGGVGIQPAMPVAVADDRHRSRCQPVVLVAQRATSGGAHAHRVEVVSGDEVRLRAMRRRAAIAAGMDEHRRFAAAYGSERFERQRLLPQVPIGVEREELPAAGRQIARRHPLADIVAEQHQP